MERGIERVIVAALAVGAGGCGGNPCVYGGVTYSDGASFASTDGCNTCGCSNGTVACTARACAAEWYRTCGDPVCGPGGHRDAGVAPCTTEKLGDPCANLGAKCDPNDPCNADYVCASSDPTKGTGGCPISRARWKRDVRYLDGAERERVARALLDVPLATWRYASDGAGGRARLGFLIDDVEGAPAVAADGEHVDLYGYASMTVAAVQEQAREIERLRREVRALRRRLDGERAARPIAAPRESD